MPEPKVHCKFEVDPNYDRVAALSESIDETRTHLERELASIDAISDVTLQAICLFAMLDCLAQEQANYPKNFKEAFCQFVLRHQKQCDYLEKVEPVTLFYHVEDLIEEAVPFPGFQPEKVVSLEDLGYLYGKPAETIMGTAKAQQIFDYLQKQQGKEFAERKAAEHQLISLIYRMRSKAVHEMSGLGETSHDKKPYVPGVPYYREVGRAYVLDGNWVHDDVVELVIPNEFLRNILIDCIDGYLSDCKTSDRFPFSNNNLHRKHLLSWYDR